MLVAAVAMLTGLARAEEKKEDNAKVVQLKDCPEAVQKTIKENAGDATIKEIEQADEKGKAHYDVVIVKDGQEKEFSVAPDGKFLGWEEDEQGGDKSKEQKGEHND
jgi:uncharacterized membrane protein YkoI